MGECPELPEEGHDLVAYGALADYYAGFRQSQSKAQAWNNMYFTGDFNNNSRDENTVKAGLFGLVKKYRDRNDSQLIDRGSKNGDVDLKLWATTLS